MWFSLTFKLDIQEEKGGQAKFGPACSLLLAVLMKSLRVKCLPFTRHKISYDNDNIKTSSKKLIFKKLIPLMFTEKCHRIFHISSLEFSLPVTIISLSQSSFNCKLSDVLKEEKE